MGISRTALAAVFVGAEIVGLVSMAHRQTQISQLLLCWQRVVEDADSLTLIVDQAMEVPCFDQCPDR